MTQEEQGLIERMAGFKSVIKKKTFKANAIMTAVQKLCSRNEHVSGKFIAQINSFNTEFSQYTNENAKWSQTIASLEMKLVSNQN